MKTLFTFALAGLLATSTLAANSNEDLLDNTDARAKFKKVNVLLKEGIGKTKVAILNEDGKILHQRKVKVGDEKVLIPYDLNNMPCGEYQVKISTEEDEVIYTVETFDKRLEMDEYPLMAYGKIVDDETVNIAVIGLSEPGVDIKVRYADSNKLIHAETINHPDGFRKDFKLKGVSPDEVYFEITDNLGRTKNLYF
ncbi:MAG: hypothetical protein HWE15_13400 [Algoriphagus sp.]|uniref:hypothetical protein n=1 Tax=Algoriphagus sp. TaxID=1872435 RepID=UPI00183FC851|nr:hypothetical protein [Algoriphagus sp.]NVJ87300.1 hypothetical protein [Algoriphagus sp.]